MAMGLENSKQILEKFEKALDTLGTPQRAPLMKADEATKLLALPAELPPKFGQVFGAENIKELLNLLSQPDNLALDMINFTEPSGREQGRQFASSLPEVQKTRLDLLVIAKKFVESVKQKRRLAYLIRKSLETDKVVTNVGTKAEPRIKTRTTLMVKTATGVVDLFRLTSEFVNKLIPQEMAVSFRAFRIKEFIGMLEEFLTAAVLEEVDTVIGEDYPSGGQKLKAEMRKNFTDVMSLFSLPVNVKLLDADTGEEKQVLQTVIGALVAMQRNLKRVLANYASWFTGIDQAVEQDDLEKAKSDNEKRIQEIWDLASLHSIDSIEKVVNGVSFSIIKLPERLSDAAICGVLISFVSAETGKVHRLWNHLDRASLKLRLSHVHFLDSHIPEPILQKIYSIVYQLVIDGLKAGEAKEDLLIGFEVPKSDAASEAEVLNADIVSVAEEVKMKIQAANESGSSEECGDEQEEQALWTNLVEGAADSWKRIGFVKKEVKAELQEILDDTATPVEAGKRKKSPKLWGLSVMKVRSILERILGSHKRSHGSHYIYERVIVDPQTGREETRSWSIPLNVSYTVSPVILRRAIRELKIEQEFYDELTG